MHNGGNLKKLALNDTVILGPWGSVMRSRTCRLVLRLGQMATSLASQTCSQRTRRAFCGIFVPPRGELLGADERVTHESYEALASFIAARLNAADLNGSSTKCTNCQDNCYRAMCA